MLALANISQSVACLWVLSDCHWVFFDKDENEDGDEEKWSVRGSLNLTKICAKVCLCLISTFDLPFRYHSTFLIREYSRLLWVSCQVDCLDTGWEGRIGQKHFVTGASSATRRCPISLQVTKDYAPSQETLRGPKSEETGKKRVDRRKVQKTERNMKIASQHFSRQV